jgi:hypothetical protein
MPTSLIAADCRQLDAPFLDIELKSFSQSNYVALEKGVGKQVCITGRLSVDSAGVYYRLQPMENKDIINLGFSRINTGLNTVTAIRRGIKNRRIQTICGLLNDETPFRNCNSDDCKWFGLTNAQVRTRKRF